MVAEKPSQEVLGIRQITLGMSDTYILCCSVTHACMLSRFSCVGLFATPWTHTNPLSSSILEELSQARILEWVAISFCRGSS